MIGRRLRSGLAAVPVRSAKLLRGTGKWCRTWRLELECGHVLEEHETYLGDRRPTHAGCPEGCGEAIGGIRRALKRKEAELLAEERKRWARQRARLRSRPRRG